MLSLTLKSFSEIFDDKESNIPLSAKKAIEETNFKYREVEGEEYNQAILKVIKTLDSQSLKVSGPHRQKDWEKGWEGHLEEFRNSKSDLDVLVGKFAMRGEYNRLQGKLIKPESNSFESNFVNIIRLYLFNKYFKDINTLYEFGAGTGVNLVATAKSYPKMKLVGLDWANSSVELINSLKEELNIDISARRMDLFNPDESFKLDENSAVLTVGTLEQLGENFKPFVNYLLKNKPKICIHLETLYEAYNPDNLLDYLAMKYLVQRNYLRGFLPFLKKLESDNQVKILEVRRTFGSFFHEGYTYTIWQPL